VPTPRLRKRPIRLLKQDIAVAGKLWWLFLIFLAFPLFVIWSEVSEHSFRMKMQEEGVRKTALILVAGERVFRKRSGYTCGLIYSFTVNGKQYDGRTASCEIVRPHIGKSRVKIIFDSRNPSYSYLANEGFWKNGGDKSVVLMSCILLLVVTLGVLIAGLPAAELSRRGKLFRNPRKQKV
jgi:hypothetical protein